MSCIVQLRKIYSHGPVLFGKLVSAFSSSPSTESATELKICSYYFLNWYPLEIENPSLTNTCTTTLVSP